MGNGTATSTLTYLLGDHLGSTSLTFKADTYATTTQLYKPWGEVRYQSGTLPTQYTYTGQYSHTTDFGLMYYIARWYDPVLGRFAQADTLVPGAGHPLAWDRYAYALNSPLVYNDPSGHSPSCPGCTTITITSGNNPGFVAGTQNGPIAALNTLINDAFWASVVTGTASVGFAFTGSVLAFTPLMQPVAIVSFAFSLGEGAATIGLQILIKNSNDDISTLNHMNTYINSLIAVKDAAIVEYNPETGIIRVCPVSNPASCQSYALITKEAKDAFKKLMIQKNSEEFDEKHKNQNGQQDENQNNNGYSPIVAGGGGKGDHKVY